MSCSLYDIETFGSDLNDLNEKVRKKGQNTTTRCTMIYSTVHKI